MRVYLPEIRPSEALSGRRFRLDRREFGIVGRPCGAFNRAGEAVALELRRALLVAQSPKLLLDLSVSGPGHRRVGLGLDPGRTLVIESCDVATGLGLVPLQPAVMPSYVQIQCIAVALQDVLGQA